MVTTSSTTTTGPEVTGRVSRTRPARLLLPVRAGQADGIPRESGQAQRPHHGEAGQIRGRGQCHPGTRVTAAPTRSHPPGRGGHHRRGAVRRAVPSPASRARPVCRAPASGATPRSARPCSLTATIACRRAAGVPQRQHRNPGVQARCHQPGSAAPAASTPAPGRTPPRRRRTAAAALQRQDQVQQHGRSLHRGTDRYYRDSYRCGGQEASWVRSPASRRS